MAIIIYLLKVNLALVAFYTFYWVFLRKNTFFQTNRFYLVSSVIVSFLLPLIKIKHNYITAQPLPLTLNEISFQQAQPVLYQPVIHAVEPLLLTWFDVISMIYWAGVCFLAIRFIYSIIRVFVLLNRSEPLDFVETYTGTEYWLLQSELNDSSFSFFNFLVLNQDDLRQNQSIIKEHEEVHINQKHSWDIVLMEIVHVFCWLNPAVFFYKKSLKLLHEFIADQFVNDLQPADYAQFLFAYNFRTNTSHLSNDFYRSSLLKERIKMLVRNRSSKWVLTKYVFVIPLVILIGYFVMAQNVRRAVLGEELTSKMAFPAEFRGGGGLLGAYINDNLRYPLFAKTNKIEGNVFASFAVNDDGNISNVKIIRSLENECDEEVLKLLRNMPVWNPQVQVGGKAILSRQYIMIKFKTDGGIKYKFHGANDPRFRGIILIDGNIFDYGDEFYSDDWDKLGIAQKITYGFVVSRIDSGDEVNYYRELLGSRVYEGLQVFYTKEPLFVKNNIETSMDNLGIIGVSNVKLQFLTPKEGFEKYGEKGKNGAIIEIDK